MMSENLKKLRKEKGLTQVELAEKLNLSQSTIASWENGMRRPDLDFLPVIAGFFGVTIGELYGQDETQPDAQLSGHDPNTKKKAAPLGGLEEALMEKYRQLTPDQQKQADLYLDFLIASQDKKDT